ncbi:MAG: quinolinate synthetase [bacterium ADurb.Bin429]|nr:MAG: quinolinate synthetase [bacterium ADurb.Bin429]
MPVLDLADIVASTSGMLRLAHEDPAAEFIVATEEGLLHRLRKENRGKQFYHVAGVALCPNMKKITLEKVLWSLQDLQYPVDIPTDVADRARLCIERMVAASK